MPKKSKKPYGSLSCPNLTDGRYCEKHEKQANRSYEKYGRDKVVHCRYGRAWKRIRDSHVQIHPFCELCFENRIIVSIDEVHHKLPLSEGGTYDRSNLISLCKSCHAKIYAECSDYQGSKKHRIYS